jgi:hypothetical protein
MAKIDLPHIRDLKPGASLEEKYQALYDAYFMLIKRLSHALKYLDSENVSELDANVTNIKNLVAETIITQTLVTQTLYAEKGYIAELTVDQLDSSSKVQKYLDSDTNDVNYIKIYEQNIEFITASVKFDVDGITPLAAVQAEDRFGEPLYWTDGTHTAVTYTANEIPVMIYQYDELVKAKITFEYEIATGEYVPKIVLGAGTGTGDNAKGFIYKGTTGLYLDYYHSTTGELRRVKLTDDGVDFGEGASIQGMPQIFVQATEPTTAKTNDVWIDSDETTLETILTNLAGGTTGQVLRKKSDADYDFEWVTLP